jgi:phenylacetate-coenzyme A ligase PaaK-like adenylate-forming protein
VLCGYPSYLGKLVEEGLKRGLTPDDFSLRRIDTGGEIVTEGFKRRAQKLLGPVGFCESYGSTETWGTGGDYCSKGHLHFGSGGIWEFLDLESYKPAGEGEIATLVCTLLPPIRETTLLIRYDTQDLVRLLTSPLECEYASMPASSHLLGRRKHSLHHPDGSWTFPRQVMEALESLEVVPLPARFGFWSVEGGVAVDVITLNSGEETRRMVKESLEAQGVMLKELRLLADPAELCYPFPLRGDLIERSFGFTQ